MLCRRKRRDRGPGLGSAAARMTQTWRWRASSCRPVAVFLKTRTGIVENGPYCEQPWCYVEDPSQCVDPNTGVLYAHMSAFDTKGNVWTQVNLDATFETMGTAEQRFKYDFPLGESLFYSYEVCGAKDYYTTAMQAKDERDTIATRGGTFLFGSAPLYTVDDFKVSIPRDVEDFTAIAKQCVMPDGRVYPWQQSPYDGYRLVRGGKYATEDKYSPLTPSTWKRKIPLTNLSSVKDGDDGFWPSFCQSSAARMSELGLGESREPQFCYAYISLTTFFENNFYSAVNVEEGLPVSSFAMTSHSLCGDIDAYSDSYEKITSTSQTTLGNQLMSSFLNWLPKNESVSVDALEHLSETGSVRKLTSFHVDDCATECSGRRACKEWVFVQDDKAAYAAGENVTLRLTSAGKLTMESQDGMIIYADTQQTGFERSPILLNRYFLQYNTSRPWKALLKQKGNLFAYVYQEDGSVASLPAIELYSSNSFYVSRCFLVGASTPSSAYVASTPNSALVVRRGRIVYDIEPRDVPSSYAPLRTAAVRFFTNTRAGKWIKDTLFPDELEYKLEKRRQNFNAENARTLFNEEELRRIDSRQMVAEEESARIVLRLIIAMRALRKVTVKDIVPNVDYFRDLSAIKCQATYVKRGIQGCPKVTAVRTDTLIPSQKKHAYERTGVTTDLRERTVATMINDDCGETEGIVVVYNHSDLFIVFKDTEYTEWRATVDIFREGRNEHCSSPYLTGKVHCGALTVLMRSVSKLLVASKLTVNPDICTILMEGKRCRYPPRVRVGGFSVGSMVATLFVAFLDNFLDKHYGIDLASAHRLHRHMGLPLVRR